MEQKYESLKVNIEIGKTSLVSINDEQFSNHAEINLYTELGAKCVGSLVLDKDGFDFIRNGGKLKTKSVNQFRKSIK